MKIISACLFTLAISLACAGPSQTSPSDLSAKHGQEKARKADSHGFLAFEERTGVALSIPTVEEIGDAKWVAADPAKVAKIAPQLEAILMRYNTDVRGHLVKKVVFYENSTAANHSSGGLALPKEHGFVITVKGKKTREKLANIAHHEIGHLVMYADQKALKRWPEISRGKYAEKGQAAPTDLYGSGFLSKYGSSNMKEDFAEFALMGFHEPETLLGLAEKHDRIREKVLMMDKAYGKVCPQTERPWHGQRFDKLKG